MKVKKKQKIFHLVQDLKSIYVNFDRLTEKQSATYS